jgi:glutaredoxin 3
VRLVNINFPTHNNMSQNYGRSAQLDSQIISDIQLKMETEKVFILSKVECAACIQTKAFFNKLATESGVTPFVLDLDKYSAYHKTMIMKFVMAKTGNQMLPQIWINGKFIGGNDEVHRLYYGGQLATLVEGKTNLRRTTDGRVASRLPSVTRVVSPARTEALTKSVKKEDRSKYSNDRKNIQVCQSSLQYRPLTYTIDNERKQMPPKSHSEKFIHVKKAALLQSSPINYLGNIRSNSMNFKQTYLGNNRQNTMNYKQQLTPPTQRSVARAAESCSEERNRLLDQALLNKPAIVLRSYESRRVVAPQGVVVSRVI